MTFKGNRIAAYARFSSDKQSETSAEDQLRRLREHVSRHDRQLDDRLVFKDEGISGASTHRPGFEQLMGMVRRREIDVLLVESIDRLSRNLADSSRMREEFDCHGVQLVALSDGIDTANKGSKLAADIKSVFASMYLDDLRDKTLRGMQGRAHAGLSTGLLPIGYRTRPIPTADPKRSAGHTIEIDPERALIVRRIFAEWIAGGSFGSIAASLNRDKVPSPRDRTKHAVKPGWGSSTVRGILMNERYGGIFIFGSRRWAPVPGEHKRRPLLRDASEVLRDERPELAIVPPATWTAAQERLARTRARFTVGADGKRKGKVLGAIGIVHPLSGLLRCDACGHPMVIAGGSKDKCYYVCPSARAERCTQGGSFREDIAITRILGAVQELLTRADGITRIRKRVAERLGEINRTAAADLAQLRERLARTEKRLENVTSAIADGEWSPSLAAVLRDLEAQASSDRTAIEGLQRIALAPIPLPSPDEIRARFSSLEEVVRNRPAQGREALARLFRNREIRCERRADGIFVAKTDLLPLVFLSPERTNALSGGTEEGIYTSVVAGAGFEPTTFGL